MLVFFQLRFSLAYMLVLLDNRAFGSGVWFHLILGLFHQRTSSNQWKHDTELSHKSHLRYRLECAGLSGFVPVFLYGS